jgi:UDP-N-acetylglucosamine diphosphorylase/glucosamine-1-phosphate N-acetyltransferase
MATDPGSPVLILFDDAVALDWMPFALTRPAGEMLFGASTLRARAESALRLTCGGYIGAPHLAGFDEAGAAPMVEAKAIPDDRDRIFLSARAVLEPNAEMPASDHPTLLRVGGMTAGWFAPAGTPAPPQEFFARTTDWNETDAPVHTLEGRLLGTPWELMHANAERVSRDFVSGGGTASEIPAGVAAIGPSDQRFRCGADVTIEPGVVLDFTGGPIWLSDGVRIVAFTRLAGPAWIGPHTTLFGGPFTGVSIGPRCKVHGEVEETVILGYSNKAHDGFLGHSCVGMWVNLGALTTNSDLKNNYGGVRVATPGGVVDTGMTKVGCFLGDHVKTAIGTMLGTGTVVGAGSNLFGVGRPSTEVPPFAWGSDGAAGSYDLARFLDTAETVMKRRDVDLSEGMRSVLRSAWEMAAEQERMETDRS